MIKKIEKLDNTIKYSPNFFVTDFQDMKNKVNEMIDVINEMIGEKNAESEN